MCNFPKELLKGYKDYLRKRSDQDKELLRQLAIEGQKPKTMIISCCDSRSIPEIIFDKKPGELFIVRNVANLVPPYAPDGKQHGTSAAIEFAVHGLKIKNIIIMGHGLCGGIQAALNENFTPLEKGDFIGKWLNMLKPLAKEINNNSQLSAEEKQILMEQRSIINSIKNLQTFPYIAKMQQEGDIKLFGAWFDIKEGELKILERGEKFISPF